MSNNEITLRDSVEADVPAIQAIYAYHVLNGTASFEIEPPTVEDMRGRRADVLSKGLPYLVAERGDSKFETISNTLSGFNKEWAPNASVFIVASALTVNAEGNAIPSALFDLGLSVGSMLVEAHHRGYHIHQMAGFDRDALKSAFNLNPELQPVVVLALGTATGAETLESDVLKEREAAPRERKALSEILL